VFNFSAGTNIIYGIDNSKKGKFFAIRDLFLYSSIALGLFVSSLIINVASVRVAIIFNSSFLLLSILFLSRLEKEDSKKVKINSSSEKHFSAFKIKAMIKEYSMVIKNRNFVIILSSNILGSIYAATTAFLPFLALSFGMDYQSILYAFAGMTLLNAIFALLIGDVADNSDKRLFYLIDIGSDMIPIILYLLSTNIYIFIVALIISSLKDIFAPTTFAYKYEVFEDSNGQLSIAALETFTNLFTFFIPAIIGILWNVIGRYIFCIAFIAVFISFLLSFLLPKSKK